MQDQLLQITKRAIQYHNTYIVMLPMHEQQCCHCSHRPAPKDNSRLSICILNIGHHSLDIYSLIHAKSDILAL
jgi:hypothetical protein